MVTYLYDFQNRPQREKESIWIDLDNIYPVKCDQIWWNLKMANFWGFI